MAGFRCFCVLILALLLGSAATAAAQPPTQPNGRQSAALPRAREAPPGQPAAPTAPDMKIAAIVNDEVISVFDLVSRIRMVLISSSIPDTPENRQRIAGQVLRSLIDDGLKRVKEHAGEPQSRVAEIFLAVDNPAQDEEVRHVAERLSQQMKQGARFSAVATQFSQSATAAVGGDIGWVRPDQLPPELAKAAAQRK